MNRGAIADSYLAALGLSRQAATLEFLTDLTRAHVDRIPFSSIGPRLGDDLPLDLSALHDRLVVRRRGGYCFEQNRFMFEMLGELGYVVDRYLARVTYDGDPDPPLTHRVSVVSLGDTRYVVDVGFGGIGPVAPISMDDSEVAPSWRAFRVQALMPTRFQVEAERRGAFIPLYYFDIADYGEADCELGHFYSHRHPDAIFVNHLVVMRTQVEVIRSLKDSSYFVITPAGESRELIESADRLHTILLDDLGLNVSAREAEQLFRCSMPRRSTGSSR